MAREKSFQDILNEYLVEPKFETPRDHTQQTISAEPARSSFYFPFHKVEIKEPFGSKSNAFKPQFAYKATPRKTSTNPKDITRPKQTNSPPTPELHVLNLSLSSFEMLNCLYKDLGEAIPKKISRPLLKRVYRKLAKQTHPDLASQLDPISQKKLAEKFGQIKEFYFCIDQELKTRLEDQGKAA